ncbi:response regulator [Brachybacterium sp. AOP25-B2-12]|uniref:response regulator n=1 Tax=Brachybacterium sp. AOP25-B2-12 TaxID=3457710 RepID=UPI004033B920
MITVMLVDDQELLRAGLRTIVDAHPELEVVAEAAGGIAALETLECLAVDVVLLDLDMPGIDGVETTRRIRDRWGTPSPRIVVLTTFDASDNVLAALRAGADGFLGKGIGPRELTAAVVDGARGGELSARAIDALVGHAVASPVAPAVDPAVRELFAGLPPREMEIVALAAAGLDNAEIGRQVYISPYTAKTHVNRAMSKVGARDRAHLVALAFQAGIR